MTIIEDTRQRDGRHDLKHEDFEKAGVHVIRSKLAFGDYALPPRVAIDTKRSIGEIAGNICGARSEHQRFKRECIAARDAGTQLIVLIENDDGVRDLNMLRSWYNPRTPVAPCCVQGERLAKAMQTMSERYGVIFRFCRPEEAGNIIMEILSACQKIDC